MLWTGANRRKSGFWFCTTLYLTKQQQSLCPRSAAPAYPQPYRTRQSGPFITFDWINHWHTGVKRAEYQLLPECVSRAACFWPHFVARRCRWMGIAACMNSLLALQSMAVPWWFGTGFESREQPDPACLPAHTSQVGCLRLTLGMLLCGPVPGYSIAVWILLWHTDAFSGTWTKPRRRVFQYFSPN